MADNVAITAGTGTDIAADEVVDGTLGTVKVQYVKLMDGTLDGSTKATVGAGGLKVDLGADNDVTVTGSVTATSGTAANLKVETTPATTGSGTATGAMRVELPTNGTGVIATVGAVTAISNALPAGTNAIGKLAANSGVDIGDVDVTSAVITGGAVAHDSADSGNPIKVGAKATAALSGATLVAAADRTDNVSDLDGAQIVRGDSALGDVISATASNTDGTSTQVLAAGAAGVKHYLTDITLANTSASNIYVELKDNTTTKWVFPVPANGGVTHSFRTPLAGTAATAWNFDASAATTTLYCSVSAFKSKV